MSLDGPGPDDAAKKAAAEAAVALVRDGMKLGLGTGSTMVFAVIALAERIKAEGLKVVGIPTSERTAAQATQLGIPLTDFSKVDRLDLAIDGADEVVPGSLGMIKGLGGALLREKIVASAAERFVGIVDPRKVVDALGTRSPLPVEVARFGHQSIARRLRDLGCTPTLRLAGGEAMQTDGGNYIYDCAGFGPIKDPVGLAAALSGIAGVAGHGLFLGMASEVVVGDPEKGTYVLHKTAG